MKDLKARIKEKIELYEFYSTGIRHVNGGSVRAINIKIRSKGSFYKVQADVILDYALDGRKERYNKCIYYLSKEDLHLLNEKEMKKSCSSN